MLNGLTRSRLILNKTIFQRFTLLNKATNNSTCSYIRNLNSAPLTSRKLVELSAKTSFNCVRHNSYKQCLLSQKMPPLTDLSRNWTPSLSTIIKNFFILHFEIKPFLDSNFDFQEFITKSKETIEEISKKFGEDEFRSLQGLVARGVICKLGVLASPQKRKMSVDAADIFWSFIDKITIVEIDAETAILEITTIHHVLKGWAEIKARGEELSDDMALEPEYKSRVSVCKYKFSRLYKKGIASDWIISSLDHYFV